MKEFTFQSQDASKIIWKYFLRKFEIFFHNSQKNGQLILSCFTSQKDHGFYSYELISRLLWFLQCFDTNKILISIFSVGWNYFIIKILFSVEWKNHWSLQNLNSVTGRKRAIEKSIIFYDIIFHRKMNLDESFSTIFCSKDASWMLFFLCLFFFSSHVPWRKKKGEKILTQIFNSQLITFPLRIRWSCSTTFFI